MSLVSPAQAVGKRIPTLVRSSLQQKSLTISCPAPTDTQTVTNTIHREDLTKAISLYKASEAGILNRVVIGSNVQFDAFVCDYIVSTFWLI